MLFTRSILVSAFLATLLIGCKKAETPPAPTMGGSVASPESALPPSDSALPAAPASTSDSGNANGPAQTNPKELTKQQESTDMPLSGQANNHSTTDPIEKKK
ncbi:MAG: hypothetical protein Q7T66_01220 [Herminiimonas sp.]|uniref:hypothetical protein n=1 Tax=Herminiimonas sp. TaxID=1926289 RepID=UPI00271F0B68|nr:hypothetical protein [Herminiimonas sp.]MDO9419260.1 hypothetical protein [Herminiimonas sp.]